MLPILTKPLIQYGVEEAIESDLNTMAIVTGRGKRAIEDHLDISYELKHQIKDTHKDKLPGVLSQMVKLYKKYNCSIVAIEKVPKEDASS